MSTCEYLQWVHLQTILNFLIVIVQVISNFQSVVKSEEEGRQHRIAFNSLYLFSSKSIIYEANGEALHNLHARSDPSAVLSLAGPLGFCPPSGGCSEASGRRGLHDA